MSPSGKDVFRRRRRLRLSGTRLARLAGVNKGTIVRIEHDDDTVKPRTLQLVLDALTAQERDLLGLGGKVSSIPTEDDAHASTALRNEKLIDRITYFANEIIIAVGRARDVSPDSPAGPAVASPAKPDRQASPKKRGAGGSAH